jgi:pimeloyl-ACP methyl ester carboxylesterase
MALTDEGVVAMPGLASRWARLANGAKAHYVTAGDSGPAVILLHGGIQGSSGAAGWRFMVPFLGANGFRVYAPDRPGFGLADTREEYWPKLGFISTVQFVNDFADALCLDRFHLSGNSQGCMSASYYLVTHPERVISFALIATGGFNDALGIDPSLRVPGTFNAGGFTGTAESMRTMMEGIIYRTTAISDDLIQMRVNQATAQKQAYDAHAAFNRAASTDPKYAHFYDLRGKIDTTDIPGIYLYGRQDVLGPVENAYNQEDELPNIQVFYPDECGHQGQTDQPDMFNQVFLEFFRDGKVSRKTADWAGVSQRRSELPNLVEQAVGVAR